MPKVERKEYQETKILKTVSPVRSQSSQNLSQFDSNLDYLLDDLQNSVSRPGSSLAVNNEYDNYRTNGFNSHKTNSLNRVLRVNAANPVTEYSSDDAYSYKSPDGSKRIEGYKKESYSYRTTGGGNDVRPEKVRVQNSINQLDSLLDDLKEAKKTPLMERDIYGNYVDTPTIGERNEKYSTSTVKRELHYGDTPQTQRSSTLNRRIEKEQMVSRDNEYRTNEGFYNHTTSSSPPSRSSTLSRQMKVKNVHTSPVEVVQTTCPEINPEILEHLDPALRPPENTKVTTTIKTYTYEIPGTLDYRNTSDVSMDSKKYVYSPNDSQSTPSKSFVYEKLENIENKRTVVQPEINYETRVLKESTVDNYKPYKKPNPPGYDGNVTETITTRNYQPGYPRSNNEYVYNETVTTKNIDNGYPIAPPQKKTYIVEETIDERNYIDNYPVRDPPPQKTYVVEKTVNERNYVNDYPVRDPPRKETYVYKETHNTFNKEYPNQPRDYIDRDATRVSVRETNINRINEPPYRNDYQPPQQPINIKYKYTTTSSTTNNYKTGYPPNEEGELLLPRPFPTEERVDGPPKKLDELMNTIGREPPTSPLNSGYQQHELELINERKAKALKQQATEVEDLQKAEPLVKSKNVNGPPVYYPPGHEMFAKKEEGAAAWRAQGAYARESGKYEYEAESKSKSKSSSGAAIVPVCLPLCCGLPCTII